MAKAPAQDQWQYIGEHRVTCYCQYCIEPAGFGSASGKELAYGDAACAWLPIGTEIAIEGEIFTVVDRCGTDAIDLFIPSTSGRCECNYNEYKHISEKVTL